MGSTVLSALLVCSCILAQAHQFTGDLAMRRRRRAFLRLVAAAFVFVLPRVHLLCRMFTCHHASASQLARIPHDMPLWVAVFVPWVVGRLERFLDTNFHTSYTLVPWCGCPCRQEGELEDYKEMAAGEEKWEVALPSRGMCCAANKRTIS